MTPVCLKKDTEGSNSVPPQGLLDPGSLPTQMDRLLPYTFSYFRISNPSLRRGLRTPEK